MIPPDLLSPLSFKHMCHQNNWNMQQVIQFVSYGFLMISIGKWWCSIAKRLIMSNLFADHSGGAKTFENHWKWTPRPPLIKSWFSELVLLRIVFDGGYIGKNRRVFIFCFILVVGFSWAFNYSKIANLGFRIDSNTCWVDLWTFKARIIRMLGCW